MSFCDLSINTAGKLKVDESEAVLSTRQVITVRITDSEIAEVKEINERRLGIRLIKNNRITSTETNVLEDASRTVEEAFSVMENIKPKPFWKKLPSEFKKKLL